LTNVYNSLSHSKQAVDGNVLKAASLTTES